MFLTGTINADVKFQGNEFIIEYNKNSISFGVKPSCSSTKSVIVGNVESEWNLEIMLDLRSDVLKMQTLVHFFIA